MDIQPHEQQEKPVVVAVSDDQVTVDYLPAAHPFHHSYDGSVTLATVRSEAMAFFGVSDHKDRDTHLPRIQRPTSYEYRPDAG
jgi:hypothetical protein